MFGLSDCPDKILYFLPFSNVNWREHTSDNFPPGRGAILNLNLGCLWGVGINTI